jgi:acetoin utilization deacetylase AcuC-like enzyme
MSTGFICDERYFWVEQGPAVPLGRFDQPLDAWDSPEGKRRMLNLLDTSGLLGQLAAIPPRMATEDELGRLHDPSYVAKVRALSEGDGGSVGEQATVAPGSYDILRLAAGGCMTAVDAVLAGDVDNAFAFVHPAGHHAEKDRGRGFCIFANTALAVTEGLANYGLRRVAVVDWDVHHGNGTQSAFYDNGDVLTISIHQDRRYPQDSGGLEETGAGDGVGANINVPLPAGSGHGAYVETIDKVVVPALKSFRPELIVIACGFDANGFDPLGRMMCHSETYRAMTRALKQAAAELCAGRLVVCLEGGYSPGYMPYCCLAVVETLADVRTEVEDVRGQHLAGIAGQDLQPHQAAAIEAAAALLA